VKVFFTNLEFKNDVLLSNIKGVRMEINKKAWKDVVGLKSRGVQVRKGEIGDVLSTLTEGDLILMYCTQYNVQVDQIYLIRDHILKAKRLTDFKLPYVVLMSKFI